MGPTASGKTELALRWAKAHGGEIVSADSRQVYKHLSVGTAKPQGQWTPELYRVSNIPYHLVDIIEPDQTFTAADFVRRAGEKIAEIRVRGATPILVGGTGLYLKAFSEGLAPLPPRDEAVRAELLEFAEKQGRPALHAQLQKVDPVAAEHIPANNIQRVLRALEVYRLTKKPLSQWHSEHQAQASQQSPLTFYGIDLPLKELHQRIEVRCAAMLENGMIEETQALMKQGVPPEAPGLTGLGYPRVIAYLKKELTRENLLKLLIQDTRQYAKRQRTWFRHQAEVQWNPPSLNFSYGGSSAEARGA